MPRGDSPNSRKNLKRPTEELRQRALNGSKKSAEVRKVFKNVKEVLLQLGEETHTNSKGQQAQGYELLGRKLFSMAQQGNMKAMDMYLRMCGELTNNVDVTTNGKDIVNEPLVLEIIDKREQVENNDE